MNGEAYEIVSEADDVCRFCPNLINGVCRDNEKVCRFDTLTEKFGTGDISKICADCQWYAICKKI